MRPLGTAFADEPPARFIPSGTDRFATARAAATSSFTRRRITLRLISAKAAWICKKARPTGVVVSAIGRGVQGAEAHAPGLRFVHEARQIARESPEVVEVEHDRHIAASQVAQILLQTGPIHASPAAAVLEDALAPGSLKRTDPAVEHLSLLAGRRPSVTDRLHLGPPPAR